MSLELLAATEIFIIPHMPHRKLQLRIGLHSGMCSIIDLYGKRKYPIDCDFGFPYEGLL